MVNKHCLGGMNLFLFLYRLAITLFIFSLSGYILVVMREKFFLKNNMIIIDNKYLTQQDLEEADIREFIFRGQVLKSGDEILVYTRDRRKVLGTIIGAKKDDDTIHIITYKNRIVKCRVEDILKFKVISKYGRFFNS